MANRPPRVQFAGADAQLGAKAIAKAIGEARRDVVIDAGRINSLHKMCRRLAILGDNGFRMSGAVAIDVLNGFVDTVDDLDRYNQIGILGCPVVLTGEDDIR